MLFSSNLSNRPPGFRDVDNATHIIPSQERPEIGIHLYFIARLIFHSVIFILLYLLIYLLCISFGEKKKMCLAKACTSYLWKLPKASPSSNHPPTPLHTHTVSTSVLIPHLTRFLSVLFFFKRLAVFRTKASTTTLCLKKDCRFTRSKWIWSVTPHAWGFVLCTERTKKGLLSLTTHWKGLALSDPVCLLLMQQSSHVVVFIYIFFK